MKVVFWVFFVPLSVLVVFLIYVANQPKKTVDQRIKEECARVYEGQPYAAQQCRVRMSLKFLREHEREKQREIYNHIK